MAPIQELADWEHLLPECHHVPDGILTGRRQFRRTRLVLETNP